MSTEKFGHRKIIHVDMDCFFAAVEMRDNPALINKPIAVGGQADSRGVLCTANYPARKFGVRSAMSSSYAVKLCPELIILPVRGKAYKEESRAVFEIFSDYTELVQSISLDEAFLDVTNKDHCRGSATLMAKEIRRRIFEERGLTASAGIAPNKFLAKIASDWNEPNGQYLVGPEMVDDFIRELDVSKIWGVGKVTAKRMYKLGLKTCGDVQSWEKSKLEQKFGKFGLALYDLSRGIDFRPVVTESRRKSFSLENTFNNDLIQAEVPVKALSLFEQLKDRLEKYLLERPEYQIRKIFIKLKFSNFKSTTVECVEGKLDFELFKPLLMEGLSRSELEVRLIGLGVKFNDPDNSELQKVTQLDFLDVLFPFD